MTRIDYYKVAPGGIKPLHALEQYLRTSGLEPALLELVKLRAFAEKELVDLTVAVVAINAWNRLAVTFRAAVGSYKPAAATAASA